MTLRVRHKRRQVDDGEFRRETGQFGEFRADQKLADKQRVPGIFGVNAHLDAVARIGAAIEVLREQGLALHMRAEVAEHRGELCLGLLAVAVPPQNVVRELVVDGVLVLGRTAGVVAGKGRQRAAFDHLGFAIADRMLIERRGGQVPMNRFKARQTEFIGAEGVVPHTCFLHASLPNSRAAVAARPDRGLAALKNIDLSLSPGPRRRDHTHQAHECQDQMPCIGRRPHCTASMR